jgi:cytosine/adenosine deaminase-related metal-dependent hydrolase
LLAEGWRSDVLIAIEGCMISAITPDVPSPADALHVAGVAVPGLPNVHSHAFQRAMAGLTERRGPEDDSFWTWREVMYVRLQMLCDSRAAFVNGGSGSVAV